MSDRSNITSIARHEVIRILTVDDHQLLREGIVAVLERQEDMCVVGQAGSGREAIESFRRLRPDVTLMDLRMPDMSGLEAISAIRTEFSSARIVVLTTYLKSPIVRRREVAPQTLSNSPRCGRNDTAATHRGHASPHRVSG